MNTINQKDIPLEKGLRDGIFLLLFFGLSTGVTAGAPGEGRPGAAAPENWESTLQGGFGLLDSELEVPEPKTPTARVVSDEPLPIPVKILLDPKAIEEALKSLKASTAPGRSLDGARIMVYYEALGKATSRAIDQGGWARKAGWGLNTYTGILDRVFNNHSGELCFTMFVLERLDDIGTPGAFRTFNTVRGRVKQLIILGT